MNAFSISELSQFSGIKAHTIRMWEQRYNALKPNRSEGNTRYYDNSQLRRLLNIVSLSSEYKISELCVMPDEKLFELLKEPLNTVTNDLAEYFISQLIASGMSYDELHFDKIFSHCLLRYGLKDTYLKVLYPMLVRIGLMWANNSIPPAHEHFISNLLRQKMFTAIDSLPPVKKSADTWLLLLPENEFHETGLLFANYLIQLFGKKVVYLGCNVPIQSAAIAIQDTKPANLLLFLVHSESTSKTQQYLTQLSSNFNGKKIYVAGNGKLKEHLNRGKKIELIDSVETLEQKLS